MAAQGYRFLKKRGKMMEIDGERMFSAIF